MFEMFKMFKMFEMFEKIEKIEKIEKEFVVLVCNAKLVVCCNDNDNNG
jgi:hypothetical protein